MLELIKRSNHSTILNIYFADLLGVLEELLDRWDKTAFCAYGIWLIIENNLNSNRKKTITASLTGFI